MDEPESVWVVYIYDSGPKILAIFKDEIVAYRYSGNMGYGYVKEVPFGMDIQEALK